MCDHFFVVLVKVRHIYQIELPLELKDYVMRGYATHSVDLSQIPKVHEALTHVLLIFRFHLENRSDEVGTIVFKKF